MTCRVLTRQLSVCVSSFAAAAGGRSTATSAGFAEGSAGFAAAFAGAAGFTAASSAWLAARSGRSAFAAVARSRAIQQSSDLRIASASGPGSGCNEPRRGRTTSSMRWAKSASSSSPSVAELPFSV